MSSMKPSGIPAPRKEPEGRPARVRKSAAPASAVRSAKRKASVVLEMLRGVYLEPTSRKDGVTAAILSEWRGTFLAAGAEGFKERQEGPVDRQGQREKRVIADLAMENKLLRERLRHMKDFKLLCGGGRASELRPVGLHRAILRAGSGAEGVGPAAADILRAAPGAPLPAAACPARPKDLLQ